MRESEDENEREPPRLELAHSKIFHSDIHNRQSDCAASHALGD